MKTTKSLFLEINYERKFISPNLDHILFKKLQKGLGDRLKYYSKTNPPSFRFAFFKYWMCKFYSEEEIKDLFNQHPVFWEILI